MESKDKKILIVEDEAPLLRALETKFKTEGFQVVTAPNGEDGLKAALSEHPDLILLDIVMPKMDGVTVLKKLRETDWGAKANVIFLTNLSDPGTVTEAMHERVYDFLVKSDWKMEAVLDKVNKVLGLKPRS